MMRCQSQTSIQETACVTSRNWHATMAATAFIISVFVIYGFHRGYPFLYLSIAGFVLCAITPFLRSAMRGNRVDIGEPIVIITLLYLAYFGIRALYLDHAPSQAFSGHWGSPPAFSREAATLTLFYVLVGLVVMIAAYYSAIGKALAKLIPSAKTVISPMHSPLPVYVIIGVGFIGKILLLQSGYGTVTTNKTIRISAGLTLLQSVSYLLPFGIVLLLCLALAGQGEVRSIFPVVVLTMLYIVVSIYTGSRGFLLSSVFMFLLPFNYLRKRIRLRSFVLVSFVLLAITVILLVPLLSLYRTNLSREASGSLQSEFGKAFSGLSLGDQDNNVKFLFNRFSGLDSVMLIQANGGQVKAQTLNHLYEAFIPRALWPGKPDLNVGGLFAITFFEQPRTVQNSINIMNVGELFWNFGIWGIVIGMALLGVIYRIIYEYCTQRITVGSVFLYTILFQIMINIEGGLSMLFAGLLSDTLIVLIVLAFCRGAGHFFEKKPGRPNV